MHSIRLCVLYTCVIIMYLHGQAIRSQFSFYKFTSDVHWKRTVHRSWIFHRHCYHRISPSSSFRFLLLLLSNNLLLFTGKVMCICAWCVETQRPWNSCAEQTIDGEREKKRKNDFIQQKERRTISENELRERESEWMVTASHSIRYDVLCCWVEFGKKCKRRAKYGNIMEFN